MLIHARPKSKGGSREYVPPSPQWKGAHGKGLGSGKGSSKGKGQGHSGHWEHQSTSWQNWDDFHSGWKDRSAYLSIREDEDDNEIKTDADPRSTAVGFVPDPGRSKRVALTKSQKKRIAQGNASTVKQDAAMWAVMRDRVPTTNNGFKKIVLMLTTVASSIMPAIGYHASILDPGYNGYKVDSSLIHAFTKLEEQHDHLSQALCLMLP